MQALRAEEQRTARCARSRASAAAGASGKRLIRLIRLIPFVLAVALVGGGSQLAWARGFNPDPVFPVGPISSTVSHQVQKLDGVASALAGRKTIVNCWSNKDWTHLQFWEGDHHEDAQIDALGLTFERTRRIQLAPVVCQTLQQVIARSASQPLYAAAAITVLAHESAHASGIHAENRAECRAIETDPRAAALLGIPKGTGRRLQHIYRGTLYPNDEPRYRTPRCPAGRPGILVPDTLGADTDLRPFEQIAKELARALPGWRNIGGGYSFGPLAPCALVDSRSEERVRFDETLLGPHPAFVAYSGAVLKTKRDFAVAASRFKRLARCDLRERRTQIREYHSSNTVSLRQLPPAIKRLAPRLSGFRILFTSAGKKINLDSLYVFHAAKQSWTELFFSAPAGQLPVSVEVRSAKALLGS